MVLFKLGTFVIASLSTRVRSIVETRGDLVFLPLADLSFYCKQHKNEN